MAPSLPMCMLLLFVLLLRSIRHWLHRRQLMRLYRDHRIHGDNWAVATGRPGGATQLTEAQPSRPVVSVQSVYESLPFRTVAPRGDDAARDDADQNEECSICLAPLAAGELATKLPCGHDFHRQCIANWLAVSPNKPTCPLCKQRVDLRDLAKSHRDGQCDGLSADAPAPAERGAASASTPIESERFAV